MQINGKFLYDDLQKRAMEAAERSFCTGADHQIGFALGLQKAASIVFELIHKVGSCLNVNRIFSEFYIAEYDLLEEFFEVENPPDVLTPLRGEMEALMSAREIVDAHRQAAEAEQRAIEEDEPPEPSPEVLYDYED